MDNGLSFFQVRRRGKNIGGTGIERNKMNKAQFEKRKKLICELVQDELYVPMKEKELAAFMQVKKEERGEFREV